MSWMGSLLAPDERYRLAAGLFLRAIALIYLAVLIPLVRAVNMLENRFKK